ncbi:hypothetical protein BC827DRAFT_1233402 [Russula dissimulans]|nr:hypothetical protein BC827DRAFT_1233402 [Russula dissimulans]
MPARHFLCCLPLRLGTFLISLAQLALFGLVAGGNWYFVARTGSHLPTHLKAVLIAFACYYTLLALASLIGFFGTIARKAGLLSTYAFALGWSIGVQIVMDAVFLYGVFSKSRETLIDRCIDGSTDQDVKDVCDNFFSGGKWALLVGFIIALVIQFWAARIVSGYAQKLNNEQTNVGPKYSNVNREDPEHQIPLAGASYAYPYNDTSNSFGRASHNHYTSSA